MVAAVLPWLYVGDRGDAKDKDLLLKLKISHILNVTPRRSVDPGNSSTCCSLSLATVMEQVQVTSLSPSKPPDILI